MTKGITYIVHGPPGCGKTLKRELLAKQLVGDDTRFVELDEYEPKVDHVHLTNDVVSACRKMIESGIDAFRVVPFSNAHI
jgi:SpoVK/Ycf46/Vps4 family AAA+-type ATPase